jgi:hypothetical protein
LKARQKEQGLQFVHGIGKRKTSLQKTLEQLDEFIARLKKYNKYLHIMGNRNSFAKTEIDTTPMEGIENEKYTEILGLENHLTTFAVCLGKRDVEDSNQPKYNPKRRVAMEKIITEIK